MKKGLALLMLLVFGLTIVACGGSTTETTATTATTQTTTTTTTETTTTTSGVTDQELVDQVYDSLSLGDITALTNSSPRLILPTSRDGVTISWAISNTDYISSMGVVTQPENEVGNQTITLTASLSKGSGSRQKVFTATVIALPPVEETPPLINETFSGYLDGDITQQISSGLWGPVSGKTGSSQFYVVSQVEGEGIPKDSKALKINAFTELQIEAPIVHDYDVLVIEADIYQVANGSPIYLQTSASSPVIGFGISGGGVDGAKVHYRTDNGTMIGTDIDLNTWYTIRLEVNFVDKTIEFFYYDETGNLVPCTDGPVSFTGSTTFNSLFIRSGSSTTTELNVNSAYITNIIANRPEALSRPVDGYKIGDVLGIDELISVENGETFTPQNPMVYNFYGSRELLLEDTDYSVVVTNPVDTNVDGEYSVVYTITNIHDTTDSFSFTQTVTVYSPAQPNVINSVTSTLAPAMENTTDLTISVLRAEGVLHYVISETVLTAEQIVASANKTSVTITDTTITLSDLVVEESEKVYLVVELNGFSNVIEQEVTHQEIVSISSAQEFYDALQMSDSQQTGKYFLLVNDIDFSGFTWVVTDNEFVAVFDGQGFTLSNLTIDKTGLKGGIFGFLENATIKDLVLDNITTSSDQSASGLLASEIRGTILIENIVIMNSTNIVSNQYGAILAGRIRSTGTSVIIRNISVSNVISETKDNYGGGLIAGMDTGTSVEFSDIYLYDFTVKEATSATATGQMAGGIIGRVQGNTTINRVVAYNLLVSGYKNIGGVIGKSDEAGVNVSLDDIFIQGQIEFIGSDHANIMVGNIADQTPVITNGFASGFDTVSILGLGVEEGHLVGLNDTALEAWWTTNIPNILASDLWRFEIDSPILENIFINLLPKFAVSLVYNVDIDDEVIYLRQDEVFTYTPPLVPGFVFVEWYSDVLMTVALGENYVITSEVTIYGKYETAPASTVSFDTGLEGPAVDDMLVNYEDLATAPTVDDTMIGGVLKTVVGWTLNGVDFDFSTLIVEDIVLVAVWETVTYTVSFEGLDSVTVAYGDLVTEPSTIPTHEMFTSIVFDYWDLAGVEYDFSTPVTGDLSLSVSWNVPLQVPVTTLDEFHYVATSGSSYSYLLMNNLDFTGYSWVDTGSSFRGEFDGGSFRISNLEINSTNGYGGIFARANGATIRNVVLDNITITTTARAGTLIGRIENNPVLVENIVVMNSSVSGGDSNGTGGLIAQVSYSAQVRNIAIINTVVFSSNKNVGGLIGRVDKAEVIVEDIYITRLSATSSVTSSTSDIGVGGVVGYITDNVASIFSGARIIVEKAVLDGIAAGGFAGYVRFPGTATLVDAYFEASFVNGQRTGLIGYNRDQVVVLDQTTIFGSFTDVTYHSQVLELLNTVTPETESWWTTNIPNILTSDSWDYHYFMPMLNIVIPELPVVHTITLDYNQGATDQVIYVWDQAVFSYPAPLVNGYVFDNWYSDIGLTTVLSSALVITGDITIYGKYDVMPPSTVSFDLGSSGLTVDSQLINYEQLAVEPVVVDTEFGGNMMTVTGWTLDGVDFDFSTPITSDIQLVAVWEVKTYEVSFSGGDKVTVVHGDLVIEPVTDPTHPVFSTIVFDSWGLGGVAYDFSTPVVSDLSLTIIWTVPLQVSVATLDEFYYVATAGTDYDYVLANNLDFTGYNWADTGNAFYGTLDGNNHVISNLTFTAANGYGGIFARVNGGSISNLQLDNITLAASTRIGLLIGRTENNPVLVENIVIMNSSVSGADSNGTGGLIGQTAVATEINNVAIINTNLTSSNKNVGGLIGRVDKSTAVAEDIYISGLTASSSSTASSDVGLGGVIGYITDNVASIFTGARIVVEDTNLQGNAGGAFIGYLRGPGTATLVDAYLEVTFVNGLRTGLIGYNRDQNPVLDQTSIFGSFTNAVTHSQVLVLVNEVIPTDDVWWNTNINSIYVSVLWTVNLDGSVVLAIAA